MANKSSFNSLKERFAKTKNSGGQNNYYPFYKIPADSQAVIRFLPDRNDDNPLGFMVEKVYHELLVNGEKKTVPCLHSYGEDCPICKVSKEYYDNDDKVNGKKFYRKKSYLAQALVVEDPITEANHESAVGHVKLISIGYSLFNIIRDAFESNELDEAPYEYFGGTNFIIKRTMKGEFANYDLSKFARRSSDLTEDQISHIETQLIDLSTLLPKKPDLEKLESLLEAALTGRRFSDDDEEDEGSTAAFRRAATSRKNREDDEDEAPARPARRPVADEDEEVAPARKPAARKPVDEDEDDEEAQAAKLLADLQARRRAAQSAEDE